MRNNNIMSNKSLIKNKIKLHSFHQNISIPCDTHYTHIHTHCIIPLFRNTEPLFLRQKRYLHGINKQKKANKKC